MNKDGQAIKLLFITQKIHCNDDDLAFVILWIKEFIRQGAEVKVICLEKGDFSARGGLALGGDDSFPVYSLGKEKGVGKFARLLKFWQLIFTLKYDRVFVHMNPEYFTYGGWYWLLRRRPMYLWYTHYTMHIHLRLAGLFCKRMFAATKQSLPQYEGSPKKIITGHGIDLDFWLKDGGPAANDNSAKQLLTIHRLCRSKRLELGIKSLHFLPDDYSLDVYGRDVEKDYANAMRALVKDEKLERRVNFKGPLPMPEVKNLYKNYRVMVNMASETIDKTMLEGMLFGVYPVTTPTNSRAIGLPVWPQDESPRAIADFILQSDWQKYDVNYLRNIVKTRHSLRALVSKMLNYVKNGN